MRVSAAKRILLRKMCIDLLSVQQSADMVIIDTDKTDPFVDELMDHIKKDTERNRKILQDLINDQQRHKQ